jgi:hypothetical protein
MPSLEKFLFTPFCGAEDQTQGLAHASHTLSQSHTPSSFARFKIGLYIFLPLSCLCSLSILGSNLLSYLWFAKFFAKL